MEPNGVSNGVRSVRPSRYTDEEAQTVDKAKRVHKETTASAQRALKVKFTFRKADSNIDRFIESRTEVLISLLLLLRTLKTHHDTSWSAIQLKDKSKYKTFPLDRSSFSSGDHGLIVLWSCRQQTGQKSWLPILWRSWKGRVIS